jgi:glucokinase
MEQGRMRNSTKKIVGIEIGGTKLQIAVSDLAATKVEQHRYTVDAAAGACGILAQIEASLGQIGVESMGAVGVGFGGPVDWKTGIIQTSHQVRGWDGFNLKAWLQERTGCPVSIENDANVAALAEARHGSGKEHAVVFYMTIGSGIGGGLVVNKSIYHGAFPGEVEIGHLRLNKDGATLESECSGWAVNKKVRAYINQNPDSLLAQLAIGSTAPEATLLQQSLAQEDAAARQMVAGVADDLAFALSHVVHLFHPQLLVIGGGLSLLGEGLRRAICDRLPRYVMDAFLPLPLVQLATLGENAVPVGALELAKTIYHESAKNNSL